MADTDILREFLVGLGFKVDEGGLKKFTGTVAAATKVVFGLAAAIEGTAVAVAAGVTRFAGNLESLYFASMRTGTSVRNLEAYSKAAQNFGASSEDARASIESLATYLRKNPGGEGFLNALGVKTRDAKGHMRDMSDILTGLGQRFAKMPVYLAEQYAGQFGISERMMLALRNGKFASELEKMRRILKDSGFQRAAKEAHEYREQLRQIEARFDAIKARIGAGVLKVFNQDLIEFGKWLDTHQTQLTTFATSFSTGIQEAARVAIPLLEDIGTGWKNIFDWTKAAGSAIANWLPQSVQDRIAQATGYVLDKLGLRKAVNRALGLPADAGGPNAKPSSSKVPFSEQGWTGGTDIPAHAVNNPGNLRFAFQPGANNVGGFASFNHLADGVDALARQLEKYSSRHLDTVRSIVSRYAPPNENNTAAYIKDVAGRLGVSPDAALNLSDPGMLDRLMNAIIIHEKGRPLADQGLLAHAASGATGRTGGRIELSQRTTIHVHGSDAKSAARAVMNGQRDVNSDLVRNFATAVR